MAARTKKSNTTDTTDPFDGAVEVPQGDLVPVELDPPDPALTRWRELADRDIAIYHGGDAEKVMPFPRPPWADPEWDDVGDSLQGSSYRSQRVDVAAMSGGGNNDGDSFEPANVSVGLRITGFGYPLIGIRILRRINGKWHESGTSITLQGALELADVLRTAVDLFGGDK